MENNQHKFVILPMVFFLFGCQNHNGKNDLSVQLDTNKQQIALPAEKPENFQVVQATLKNHNNHPFQPRATIKTAFAKQRLFKNFNLQQLKLIGVILQGEKRWALFQSPQKIAAVKIGDIFGKNKVKLLNVQKNQVLLDTSNTTHKELLVMQLGGNINV